MGKIGLKINLLTAIFAASLFSAQLFRTKDRMDNLEGFDDQKLSYGFYLAANNFDLRLEPGLQFVEREVFFDTQTNSQFAAGTPANAPFTPRTLTDADQLRTVKSTYVDFPLLVEVHGDRWYNSRPYAAAGINWMMNLQSNSSAPDDNSQGLFRTTTSNFAWSAEIGIQFYFSRFKLTPGFRGTFMMNDEMVGDNSETPPYWTAAISSAKTRAFMFVLKFE